MWVVEMRGIEYLSNFARWRERFELHKWGSWAPNLAIKRPIDVCSHRSSQLPTTWQTHSSPHNGEPRHTDTPERRGNLGGNRQTSAGMSCTVSVSLKAGRMLGRCSVENCRTPCGYAMRTAACRGVRRERGSLRHRRGLLKLLALRFLRVLAGAGEREIRASALIS